MRNKVCNIVLNEKLRKEIEEIYPSFSATKSDFIREAISNFIYQIRSVRRGDYIPFHERHPELINKDTQ